MDRVLILVAAAFLAGWLHAKPAPAADTEQQHNKRVICRVFGPRYCGEALRVAWCESRWLTWARNGQYQGTFQMGNHERRAYGHGTSARAQAEAARRYFIASGRDWSPWACRWAAYKDRTYG